MNIDGIDLATLISVELCGCFAPIFGSYNPISRLCRRLTETCATQNAHRPTTLIISEQDQ